MEEVKVKTTFWRKIFVSIGNVEKYHDTSKTSVWNMIGFSILFVLLFSIIIASTISFLGFSKLQDLKAYLDKEIPEFKIEKGELNFEIEEDKKIEIRNQYKKIDIIFSNSEDEAYIKKYFDNEETLLVIGKRFSYVKDTRASNLFSENKQVISKYTYPKEMQDVITKKNLLDVFENKEVMNTLFTGFIIGISLTIIIFLFLIRILTILMNSIIAIIFTKILKLKITYKNVFNMSVLAVTLSTIILGISLIVSIFTKFIVDMNMILTLFGVLSTIYLLGALYSIKKSNRDGE